MAVVFLVTGKTVGRCALEDIIDMALFADGVSVHTGQLKGRQVVVKGSRFPGCA